MEATVRTVQADGTLELDGGAKIRLAGILVGTPSQDRSKQVRALAALLGENPGVTLRYAQKRPPRPDRHGRIAAQVFLGGAGREKGWLQGNLVGKGLARVHGLKDQRDCLMSLLAMERQAREKGLGFWQNEVFAVHKARGVARLSGLVDTFQIVEGRVLSVGVAGRETFLNFGPVWKEDFTLIVQAGMAERLKKSGIVLTALEGAVVRVRGYVQHRGGPAIVLDVEEHLEVLRQE